MSEIALAAAIVSLTACGASAGAVAVPSELIVADEPPGGATFSVGGAAAASSPSGATAGAGVESARTRLRSLP